MKKVMIVVLCLASPMLYATNLLVNPGFETGDTTGWGARFGIGGVEAIMADPAPHSGDYAGRDFNRTANWHGIWQTQNMRDVTETGVNYAVSVWLRTSTPDPVNVAVTMQYEPTAGTVYDQIGNINVDNTAWVLFEAEYMMLDNDSTTATFYIETTGGTGSETAEIYVDDAVFEIPEPTTMALLGLGSLVALKRRRG